MTSSRLPGVSKTHFDHCPVEFAGSTQPRELSSRISPRKNIRCYLGLQVEKFSENVNY